MMEERYVFPKTSTANQSNYYWFEEGFTTEELNGWLMQRNESN